MGSHCLVATHLCTIPGAVFFPSDVLWPPNQPASVPGAAAGSPPTPLSARCAGRRPRVFPSVAARASVCCTTQHSTARVPLHDNQPWVYVDRSSAHRAYHTIPYHTIQKNHKNYAFRDAIGVSKTNSRKKFSKSHKSCKKCDSLSKN